MLILHRYLIREIVKQFMTILVTVVSIYLVVDFFEKIDTFMEAGAPMSALISFLFYKIPFIIAQIVPVGTLLSILITLGLMNKKNEIIALKSCGIGIYSLFKPIVVYGLISGIFLFFLSEAIVPMTMFKSHGIFLKEVKKVSAMTSRGKTIWIKGKRSIIHIMHYDPPTGTIFGITIHQFDENFKLTLRIDAKEGSFRNGEWALKEVMEQKINTETNVLEANFYPEKAQSVTLLPEDLRRVSKKSQEMSFGELLDFIESIQSEGYDAGNYWVDLHAKTALPFACLIMSMVGTGIAIRREFKDRLALMVSSGAAIIFIYWVLFSFCISLGYGRVLPPVLSAWLANFIFLCFGGISLIDAE
jgi:lipopolysaccharide export system permease protein